MSKWTCVLELDAGRSTLSGSAEALCDAIRNAADLRIGTEFIHNEHIDVTSDSNERIREVAEFAVTYLVDGDWAAGIMSLRQPISLPAEFGPRPSMSFFLYNQDGRQGIARPYLDGKPGLVTLTDPADAPPMPKYHAHESWDADTNAPSTNFTYDFDVFRYHVRDQWQEVLAHDADGNPSGGSITELADAFADGCEVKVGVTDLCGELAGDPSKAPSHEVFVRTGYNYYYTEQKLFISGSHPVVRVAPAVPMAYQSGNWDFGWLMLRSDGYVVYRRCDPCTLAFRDIPMQLGIRWFVSGGTHTA